MNPWIYFFSKFSDELILLEAFALFVLCAIYAGYWIIRRSKLDKENLIPASRVQEFLDQIIDETTELEQELFGQSKDRTALKSKIRATLSSESSGPSVTVHAPETLSAEAEERIRELEQLVTIKEKALSDALNEKQSIQKKMEETTAKQKNEAQAPTAAGSAASDELHKKIKNLEDRLAEYSVIEDDLANLKRLQQENQKLKTSLTQAGLPLPANPAASEASTAAPAAATTPGAASAATTSTTTLDAAPAATEKNASSPSDTTPAAQAAPGTDATGKTETPGAAGTGPAIAAATVTAAVAPATTKTTTPAPATATPATVTPAPAAAQPSTPFDSLEANVEKSLAENATSAQPATQTQPAAAPEQTAAPAASNPNPGSTGGGKSDDDLLAEFEKMLNL